MLLRCLSIIISSIIKRFHLLSQSKRQVLYTLLTSPPCSLVVQALLIYIDLHVLSILSAFILSQDQTLHSTISFHLNFLSYYYRCFSVLFFFLYLFMSSIVLSTTPAVDKNYSIKYYPLLSITFFIFFYK